MPKGKSRLRQRAVDLADLRYGTQAAGLRELLREAQSEFETTVSAQKGAASGIASAARAATPGLTKVYSDAQQSAATSQGGISQLLAGLQGPAGDTFRALIGAEAGGSAARLQEGKAAALAELSDRQTRAREGAAYATSNAAGQYLKDVRKIHAQQQDLAAQKGLYVSTTLGDLQDKRAARAVTRRGQTLSHEDRVAKQQADAAKDAYQREHGLGPYKPASSRGGGGGKGKSPYGTPAHSEGVVNKVTLAKTWIDRLASSKNFTEHQIRQALLTGDSIQVPTGQADSKGQPKMRSIKLPTIPKAFINAGYDLHAFGYLSPANVKALHNLPGGGVHVPRGWRRPRSPRQQTLPKYPR